MSILSRRLETNGAVVSSVISPIADHRRLSLIAGHRRLRFSFFADEATSVGARGSRVGVPLCRGASAEDRGVRCALGPVAQVVRAHP
jgi:hypothetical protein